VFIVFSRKERSAIEAAYAGTAYAIPIVANVAASCISFLSIIAALDGMLSWFGGLVDYPNFNFHVRI